MSTLSDILIQHADKQEIISFLSSHYKIGRSESNSELQLSRYYQSDSGVRTFVIHKDKNDEWTQIEYELGESTESLKEIDELIIALTKRFKTRAMIAYEQTASAACRFAYFENGKVMRSIIQTYMNPESKIKVTENIGEKFDFETYQYPIIIDEEIDYEKLLSYYDDFQIWLKKLGFEWTKEYGTYNDYVHLEILEKRQPSKDN